MLLPPPNLLGNHQLCNVSTAIAVARTIFNVQDQHIKKGIISIILYLVIAIGLLYYRPGFLFADKNKKRLKVFGVKGHLKTTVHILTKMGI